MLSFGVPPCQHATRGDSLVRYESNKQNSGVDNELSFRTLDLSAISLVISNNADCWL